MRRAPLVALVALALLLGSCGGDDDDGPQPADGAGLADAGADASSVPSDSSTPPPGDAGGGPDETGGVVPPPVPYDGWDPAVYAGGVVGTSVRGRTVAAERFGDSGPLVYLMFTIHGNERPAEQLGERMRTWLLLHPEATDDVQVVFVMQANPDGYVADTRRNANDVDLNRNFPAANFDNTGHPEYGPAPASEPETQTIVAIVEDADPSVIVTTHSPLNIVDFDGPADAYAEAASEASGYAVDPPDTGTVPAYPGSFGSYAGLDLQLPTITFETEGSIPARTGHDRGRRGIAAVLALAATREAPTGAVLDVVAQGAADDPYTGWPYGQSAGVRPLVAERFGSDARPVLVVAALDGGDFPTLVAERLRAVLLGRLQSELPPRQVVLVTVANPDGVVAGRALDNDGVAPNANFPHADRPTGPTAGAAALEAPEAAALVDLVQSLDPAAVFVLLEGPAAAATSEPAAAWGNAVRNALHVPDDPTATGGPGSFAEWLAAAGVPTVTLALPRSPDSSAIHRAEGAALAVLAAIDAVPD